MARKRHRRAYRYFFATDIHGSDRCFRKFLNAGQAYSADALILGGDIVGKAIVPFVETTAGRYRYKVHGLAKEVARDERDEAMDLVRFGGHYPYVCTESEYDELVGDVHAQTKLFERLMCVQVREWLRLAESRLGADVQCLITPGNDDPVVLDAVLRGSERVECPEREVVPLGPLVVASLGATNRTPWNTHRECDEAELAEQVNEMVEPFVGERLLFNFHCPPIASGLDTVVKLDEELRPVIQHGMAAEAVAGSTAIREAIERYKPVVSLHGHIHEARAAQRIAGTVCINPGSDYETGYLRGVIVDVGPDGEYVQHSFTCG